MNIQISRIKDENELKTSLKVIQESFLTVAEEFHLTRENAPTNSAFIRLEDLINLKEQGIYLFGLYKQGQQIGFFTLEKLQDARYYLNKLAVLPSYRCQGYGGLMLAFVFEYVKRLGGGKISIGIINDNPVIKKWYQRYGFTETGVRSYSHLPFEVCLMEKSILRC